MHDDRELNIDELSAVNGGTANTGNGSLPHPKPPFDVVKWILGLLK